MGYRLALRPSMADANGQLQTMVGAAQAQVPSMTALCCITTRPLTPETPGNRVAGH